MTRVLFDSNVILDVLLDREPWVEASSAAWVLAETGAIEGTLAAHAVTAIHYLLRKETSMAEAGRALTGILRVFRVAPVDGAVIQSALSLPFSDFEDAVTATSAQMAGCQYILTRDPKGFRGSPVPAFPPQAAGRLLG